MRVGDICTERPVLGRRHESVVDAARRMRQEHVGDLIIVEGEGDDLRPVAILTDRDITVGVVAEAAENLTGLTIGDILMTSDPPILVRDDDAVLDAVGVMLKTAVRRLPVVDAEGLPIGIFTLDDAVALLGEHLQALGELADSQRTRERFVRS